MGRRIRGLQPHDAPSSRGIRWNIYATENGKEIKSISTPPIDLLHQQHGPCNLREQDFCMEPSVSMCKSLTLQSLHLRVSLQSADSVHSTQTTVAARGRCKFRARVYY